MSEAIVPDGFLPFETQSPFNSLVGPYYYRLVDDNVVMGMMVAEQHCNTSGRLHGAMICAIADIALGNNVWLALAARGASRKESATGANGAVMSTVSLSTDFTGAARVGDWVEVHVDVHKTGRSMIFANAYVHSSGDRIARISGVYKTIEKSIEEA